MDMDTIYGHGYVMNIAFLYLSENTSYFLLALSENTCL